MRVLKPNGKLLIIEPTIQGLENINKIGRLFGMEDLKIPWHNLYLNEKILKGKKINFSSTYYLFSRVLYRFFKRTNLKRDSIINKVGLILPSLGDWGVQKFYILTKKC